MFHDHTNCYKLYALNMERYKYNLIKTNRWPWVNNLGYYFGISKHILIHIFKVIEEKAKRLKLKFWKLIGLIATLHGSLHVLNASSFLDLSGTSRFLFWRSKYILCLDFKFTKKIIAGRKKMTIFFFFFFFASLKTFH